MQKYLATYNRENDNWQNCSCYFTPRFTFEAEDDCEALALAHAFAKAQKTKNSVWSLTKLEEIKLKLISENYQNEEKSSYFKDPEGIFEKAGFNSF